MFTQHDLRLYIRSDIFDGVDNLMPLFICSFGIYAIKDELHQTDGIKIGGIAAVMNNS